MLSTWANVTERWKKTILFKGWRPFMIILVTNWDGSHPLCISITHPLSWFSLTMSEITKTPWLSHENHIDGIFLHLKSISNYIWIVSTLSKPALGGFSSGRLLLSAASGVLLGLVEWNGQSPDWIFSHLSLTLSFVLWIKWIPVLQQHDTSSCHLLLLEGQEWD